ncbi:hypothetical protein MVEN_00232400 [Mycena venus]|uniref:Uncharacterized protein n=1 Tax=Mycena venus TaxID=2733690 RepID=A0A8H7DEZ7_9AGAR|nr:hypothetical protein MVEN_00232400 [Mycena venus]
MPSLFLVTLFALFTAPTALAGSSCIAFDTNWNLLAFGFNGKDYNAGTSDQWASGKPTDITASGRPPFDGKNTKCYLAEFFNAVYVLGADSSNPASIYIYNAGGKSWSTQSVTAGGFDPTSFEAILDHDTNVFYALSKGELWSLDMGELAAAQSNAVTWQDGGAAEINTSNYDPVMAIAQNHIFFFGVPGVTPGDAPHLRHSLRVLASRRPELRLGFPRQPRTGYLLLPRLRCTSSRRSPSSPTMARTRTLLTSRPTQRKPSPVPRPSTPAQRISPPPPRLCNSPPTARSHGSPYSASDKNANSAAKWSPVAALNSVIGASPSSGGSSSGGSSAGASGSNTAKGGASQTSGAGSPATGSPSKSGSAPGASGSGTSGATRQVVWGSGTVLGLVAVALSLL